MIHPEFKDIEPYNDEQTREAIQRILDSPLLDAHVKNVNPNADLEAVRRQFASVQSVDDFQKKIMATMLFHILRNTARHFTFEGLDQLDPKRQYLFVSNHRDITLDAGLLNLIFLRNHFPACEIAFGDNLIANPLLGEIARCNRMFPIARSASRREFYRASLLTSQYIRYAITEKGRSVWIAQRNGRTKDGNDQTEPGLIKMFSMSSKADFVENMSELNIVPVSVSYEFEPCAVMKIRETMVKRASDGHYEKAPGEDLKSIMQGLHEQKRDIHFCICKPITREELTACANAETTEENISQTNAAYSALATLIDKRIHDGYKLFPFNLEAYELLKAQSKEIELDSEPDFMLHLYAAPVENKNL